MTFSLLIHTYIHITMNCVYIVFIETTNKHNEMKINDKKLKKKNQIKILQIKNH